jgi:hypothetical protein
VRYDCSRISGLIQLHLCQVLDPDGLFARRLPIAPTGLKASDILGFYQRRFDLLAIMRLVMQSWFGYSYVVQKIVAAELTPVQDDNRSLYSSSPTRYVPFCSPTLPRQCSGDA